MESVLAARTGPALSDEQLLKRHRPHLLWDSQDDYRAISAESIVANPGNLLKRGDRVLAGAEGEGGRRLDLDLISEESDLGPRKEDRLVEAPWPLATSRRLQRDPRFANLVYGRCERTEDVVWLQYWLWLYFNPKALLGFGRHEGDWELIQLGLAPDTWEPLSATYSQHRRAERKEGDELESEMEWRRCEKACAGAECRHPVAYVAPFSHASYFEAGTHFYLPGTDNPDGAFFDGLPTVEALGGWRAWPGRWGASEWPAESPRSPACQRRSWDQALFRRGARRREPREQRLLWRLGRRTYPETPQIESAGYQDDTAVVRWRTEPTRWWRRTRWLLLSVHSGDEPPRLLAKRVVRRKEASGEARIPCGRQPPQGASVRISAFNWIRQRSPTSDPHGLVPEDRPDCGEPRARDDWHPRVWKWFARRLLENLVERGSASIDELRRRRLSVLDMPLDRVELAAVVDWARRNDLVKPMSDPRVADGSDAPAIEWTPTKSGRLRSYGPARWALGGASAIPPALLLAVLSYLGGESLKELAKDHAVTFAIGAIVAVQILIGGTLIAHRYLSGASARTIAAQWSRHAVELPALNRWYQSRLNQILIFLAAAAIALLAASVTWSLPGIVPALAYVALLTAEVWLLTRRANYGTLRTEAEADPPSA